MNTSELGSKSEEERIRSVYAGRQKKHLYSFLNAAHVFRIQEQQRETVALLKETGHENLATQTILDVGCGNGYWLREFVEWGASPGNLVGVDLLEDRIAEARMISAPGIRFECANAASLGFPNGAFDIVFQSTVFTSILDPTIKQTLANEMLRLTKPDGVILWYDYHVNNPRNPDVRGVTKREIHDLFPRCQIRLRRVTLAPPLMRAVAPRSWFMCCALSRLRFLCTHYLGVIQREKI